MWQAEYFCVVFTRWVAVFVAGAALLIKSSFLDQTQVRKSEPQKPKTKFLLSLRGTSAGFNLLLGRTQESDPLRQDTPAKRVKKQGHDQQNNESWMFVCDTHSSSWHQDSLEPMSETETQFLVQKSRSFLKDRLNNSTLRWSQIQLATKVWPTSKSSQILWVLIQTWITRQSSLHSRTK